MPKNPGLNIARIVYDSYPHSDLLPIDPDRDCLNLRTLMQRVRDDDIGDSLFRFLVIEIIEGGEGTLSGAIRVVRQACDDVEAVLQALVQAKEHGHEDQLMPKMKKPACLRVIVTVSGGVADVLLKPRGVAVTLYDYDVEGSDENAPGISKDPDGADCCISEWTASEPVIAKHDWPIVERARLASIPSHSRKWKCPTCGREVESSYEELAEVGSPYCTDCDCEMQMI